MTKEFALLLRSDFLSFAKKAILELEGRQIGDDRYIEYLATVLTAFANGFKRKVLINLPPQHLKTSLASICLIAWILARKPNTKILVVTYADHLAEYIAYKIRLILQSPWFQDAFATRIAKDRAKVTDFATT